jgi:hypothetical protein
MTPEPARPKGLLVRAVVWLSLAAVALGIVMHGLSGETFARIWQNIIERPEGPLVFRFVLQPVMAALAALRDGVRDARDGRDPFFWALLFRPAQRRTLLDEALIATSRIFLLGLAIDAVYQIIEFDSFHPVEAVIMALLLAFLPYIVLRGLVTRVARWWLGRTSSGGGR